VLIWAYYPVLAEQERAVRGLWLPYLFVLFRASRRNARDLCAADSDGARHHRLQFAGYGWLSPDGTIGVAALFVIGSVNSSSTRIPTMAMNSIRLLHRSPGDAFLPDRRHPALWSAVPIRSSSALRWLRLTTWAISTVRCCDEGIASSGRSGRRCPHWSAAFRSLGNSASARLPARFICDLAGLAIQQTLLTRRCRSAYSNGVLALWLFGRYPELSEQAAAP